VAAWQKVMSASPKLGFFSGASDMAAKLAAGVLPPDRAAVAPQLIFNQRLDGWLTILFTVILWFVILDMSRVCLRRLRGKPVIKGSEASYQPTQLEGIPVGSH
jgi:carbon starvation protein